jgi:transmembrane sensor
MNSPKQETHRPALDWVVSRGMSDYVFDGVEREVRRRAKRRLAAAGSLALVLAGVGAVAWLGPYLRGHTSAATSPGQRQTLVLSDGTRIELNARSRAVADFGGGRRIVRLARGEAYFQVAKDPAHPFLVETPHGAVSVTGTQFDVRLGAAGEEVTLVEGSISFRPAGAGARDVRLAPGQQLRMDGAGVDLQTLSAADLEDSMAWREGRAVFRGVPLSQAVERFAQFHGVEILVSPDVARLRLGGGYALDNLPSFLGALQGTLPVKVDRQRDGSYRISAR